MSVVALSDVRSDNPTLRVDSGYFGRAALEVEQRVKSLPYAPIGDLSVSVLSFGAYALTNKVQYQDEGIPFLRCADIKNGFVSFGDTLHINEVAHTLLYKSIVAPETVLLTMSGTVGETAVALPEWSYPINSNQDIAKIRTSGLNPYYLAAFLGSHHGRAQVDRLPVGSVQQHIFLSMIERLLVARLGDGLEERIGALARQAYVGRDKVSSILAQAELDLLDSLDLHDWSPPEPLTYTRTAAAIAEAGRLDAQYFQPAKFNMLERLQSFAGAPLHASFEVVRDLVDPRRTPDAPCRNYDLTDALQPLLDDSKEPGTFGDMESQKMRFRDGDLAVSRLRSYLREIAVVRIEDDVPSVGSSEFYVLRAKPGKLAPSAETLMVYLRAAPVQVILKWCQDGSQHPRFSERDLMSIPLPEAIMAIDGTIRQQVRQAFWQRARSTRLLATAKRAVEIAIEDGKEAAFAYIVEQENGDADPA